MPRRLRPGSSSPREPGREPEHGGAVERPPADWVRVLEKGPREEWSEAIDVLLSLKRTPRQAISTLVRRVDAMDADDRRRFAGALYDKVVRPATLEAALELLGDADKKTADRADRAIRSCRADFKSKLLRACLDRPHPRRDRLLSAEGFWGAPE